MALIFDYTDEEMKQIHDEQMELCMEKRDLYNELYGRCTKILKHYEVLKSNQPLDLNIKENRYVDNQFEFLKDIVIRIGNFKRKWDE